MDELSHEAEQLYNLIKQYCKPNPTSENVRLENMARKLYDDFRGIHNPRMLEKQATDIKEYLFHGMSAGCMMTEHCSELKSRYERLRINLRKFE